MITQRGKCELTCFLSLQSHTVAFSFFLIQVATEEKKKGAQPAVPPEAPVGGEVQMNCFKKAILLMREFLNCFLKKKKTGLG